MSYIANFLGGMIRILFKSWRFLPKGILSLFIFITFFIDLFRVGFSYAMTNLATSILSAELVINRNVHIAIENLPEYTLISFFEIVSSVMVLYYLVKFITKVFVGISGSQAIWGAMVIAIIVVGIIEISAVAVVDGSLGFVPIKDGLFFLFRNIAPVFQNIHFI